jgi:hypothetical protein
LAAKAGFWQKPEVFRMPRIAMGSHCRGTDDHGLYSLLCEQAGDPLSRVKQIGWPGHCDRS